MRFDNCRFKRRSNSYEIPAIRSTISSELKKVEAHTHPHTLQALVQGIHDPSHTCLHQSLSQIWRRSCTPLNITAAPHAISIIIPPTLVSKTHLRTLKMIQARSRQCHPYHVLAVSRTIRPKLVTAPSHLHTTTRTIWSTMVSATIRQAAQCLRMMEKMDGVPAAAFLTLVQGRASRRLEPSSDTQYI